MLQSHGTNFDREDRLDRIDRSSLGRDPSKANSPGGLVDLQQRAGNSAVSAALQRSIDGSSVHAVINSPGQPLDARLRSPLERILRADLSGVQVHSGPEAAASARAVQANAYTSGNHIVLGADVSPTNDHKTIAHEVVHTVQQSRGPVSGVEAPGGIRISDPSDAFEHEASSVAEHVAPMLQRSHDDLEDFG